MNLDELINIAAGMSEEQLREAGQVLDRLRGTSPATATTSAGAARQRPRESPTRALAEAGVPVVGPIPEPDDDGPDVTRMTEAAANVWLTTETTLPLREGSYETTANGQTQKVEYTDAATAKDIADLWAVVKGTYGDTPSVESTSLQQMLSDVQAGKPLTDQEFALLNRLRTKYAAALAKFRSSPEGKAEGFVTAPPEGSGRITREAAQALADVDGVPVLDSLHLPARSEPSPLEALREAGLPVREASAAGGAGALLRGAQDDQDDGTCARCGDSKQVSLSCPSCGGAGVTDDASRCKRCSGQGEVQMRCPTCADQDPASEEDVVPLSEAVALQALADAGFRSVTRHLTLPEPRGSSDSFDEDPWAGIPRRGGR